MTAPEEPLETSVTGNVLVMRMNRPAARNAMTIEMARGIAAGLDELDSRSDLAVGILTGTDETFCAGADIKRLAQGESATIDGRGFGGLVEKLPCKPLVAAVEGWALGGGFELVLACDLVVCGAGARFGLPEVRRGLVARAGGAIRLPQRLPRAVALELLLTGEPLNAVNALHFGLVNEVVSDGTALEAAVRLVQRIAANAPLALMATKRIAEESRAWGADEVFARQREITDPVFASADAAEGARAFAEKRSPTWTGA
ncbi:crotonase/enoyl-CoA hydratase family protein [Mycolicibacterium stellerae]|uniref:crotonase/enoyl-CoA hydratase family protein n=1 Tax=Mycolicibacterium stellerae TaxID=2358193 RepID=UPI000F0B0BE7|nr:crotonase/enoyl-CoA hydratase family protein [Mycolicibacterium stellerae]